ncbi:hypothetical protein [Pseudofulvimonas gallinarii]|jgi:hypothetical protein|uniref:Uncharacterized protein n=1 Tax=Pseudofulvimonas gallinarii TaxID=634155 RepID=A0A4R3LES0_9GAMM|nr:hypothetical protein [Pseudofulvimonas gallinarii]TCS98499.1 hypothetical protein EDC25_10879 [Pseudofulvimonas gallinarii]THD13702.1 hypothetical protein B1808_06635 [Pseudofulvimonas gallinarii]
MRRTSLIRWMLPVLLTGAAAPQVQASVGRLADIEIYDRSSGRVLPVYRHEGRHYVAGQPGNEYEIRVRSRTGSRVLAVTSVDGVNVVTGQTASPGQGGYVLEPFASQSIAGWRKSMERTAAFYFTSLPDSYAARTGRPHDVGVIGVALFTEAQPYRPPQIAMEPQFRRGEDAPAAPAARAPADSAAGSAARAQEKLGTGHGRSEYSSARYTSFQRRSSQPDEVIEIWYDSEANLVAMGVIDAPPWRPGRPRAFPAGFVPDPPRW